MKNVKIDIAGCLKCKETTGKLVKLTNARPLQIAGVPVELGLYICTDCMQPMLKLNQRSVARARGQWPKLQPETKRLHVPPQIRKARP